MKPLKDQARREFQELVDRLGIFIAGLDVLNDNTQKDCIDYILLGYGCVYPKSKVQEFLEGLKEIRARDNARKGCI